jgi:hypothetical protein
MVSATGPTMASSVAFTPSTMASEIAMVPGGVGASGEAAFQRRGDQRAHVRHEPVHRGDAAVEAGS